MSRYPHVLKIPASQLPAPGITVYLQSGHYDVAIENLLPKSVPGVDASELASVTRIDPTTKAPEPGGFDKSDPANYRFAKIGRGKRYEIHAKERRDGRRIHKSLCHRRVPELAENATVFAVSCDQCKAQLRKRGVLNEEAPQVAS